MCLLYSVLSPGPARENRFIFTWEEFTDKETEQNNTWLTEVDLLSRLRSSTEALQLSLSSESQRTLSQGDENRILDKQDLWKDIPQRAGTGGQG